MLKDYIKENRTVRGFDQSAKVSTEELMDMIDCARLSSSGMNLQPLKYFIANRDSAAAILQKATKMGGRLPERHLPDAGKEPESYIVILQDPNISTSDTFTNIDLGIAAQSITLAAVEKGYRCCMLGGGYNPEELRDELGIPDKYILKLVIAVGKSQRKFTWWKLRMGETPATTEMPTTFITSQKENWRTSSSASSPHLYKTTKKWTQSRTFPTLRHSFFIH